MTAVTAEDIVKLFEQDSRARKRLAELLVTEPDVRLALANAIIREVATKDDIKELRAEMYQIRDELRAEIHDVRDELRAEIHKIRDELKTYVDARIEALNNRIDGLEKRLSDLAALVRASLIAITITLASTVMTPLILKLLGVL